MFRSPFACCIFAYCIVIVTLFCGPSSNGQQTPTASLASYNAEFELGLDGWSTYGSPSGKVRLGTRYQPENFGQETADTYFGHIYKDWNMVVIENYGSMIQWVPMDGRVTKYNLASVEATRFRISFEAPGDASFGITYYDQNFNELREVSRPILREVSGTPFFIGDRVYDTLGIGLISVGGVVPENARWAKMWIRNDNPAGLMFDSFYLLNYEIANNLMQGLLPENAMASGEKLRVDGSEFFAYSRSSYFYFNVFTGTPPFVFFGSSSAEPGVAYQPLRVNANQRYRLSVVPRSVQANTAWIGVVHYNASGVQIGEVARQVPPATESDLVPIELDFQVPANATNSTFWIYNVGATFLQDFRLRSL